MTTKKITLNELRNIVKEIVINENNDELNYIFSNIHFIAF